MVRPLDSRSAGRPTRESFLPVGRHFFDGSIAQGVFSKRLGFYERLLPYFISLANKGSKPERGEDRSIVGGRKSAVLEFIKRFETVKYFLRTLADALKFRIVSTYLKSPKRRVLKSLPKPNEAQKVALARSRHPNVLKVPLRMTICFRDSLLPSGDPSLKVDKKAKSQEKKASEKNNS